MEYHFTPEWWETDPQRDDVAPEVKRSQASALWLRPLTAPCSGGDYGGTAAFTQLVHTHSHSFLRACGVLWILCAWCAMMMSFCSTSPPRRRCTPWGLSDPEPWSEEPPSSSPPPPPPPGTSKLAARGGSPACSDWALGTCRELERDACARPWRGAELGFLQASGSGGDREDWTCMLPDGERRPGVRERERDWSEPVSISTAGGGRRRRHDAARETKWKDKRNT
ncbi:hypothetical protein EYF80_024816 [Liparis tanakae]|uniref:Uncharacterized protein n=1 Tax=Liparis tanakae TaxID=230148 RepID=A0A4Z2HJ94_9TELE|nr:hypothetical protein EYF80_024816 [Liparis tanakae]